MKILHVLGDSAFGGGSRIILTLARHAKQHGHEVAVLATDRAFVTAVEEAGLEPVVLDVIRRPIRPFFDIPGAIRLGRWLRRHPYDVVHTHTSKAGFFGRLGARLAGCTSVVHTVHGFAFHERSPRPIVAIYVLAERLAARWCTRIVTVSHYHRDWALRLGIGQPDQIVAVPNGIAPARTLARSEIDRIRSGLGIPPDAVAITSAGRLAPGKGLPQLIDAFAKLVRVRHEELRLVLPGTGPIEQLLRARVSAFGIDGLVCFPGFRDDVRDIVAASDIVALPSEREGLSLALLEAMAAGIPIVASQIGSNREVTLDGECARLVPPADSAALEREIGRLLDAPESARDLGHAAVRRFMDAYCEERMLSEYLGLYHDLLGGGALSDSLPSRTDS